MPIQITVSHLRDALPLQAQLLLDTAIVVAEAMAAELWAVGGSIRDLAMGLPVRDVDLATSGDPSSLALGVTTAVPSEVRTEPRFGTARVGHDGHSLDFAALRTEHYAHPGALPSVRLGASIEDDLARRDFTVNAFALGLTSPVRDTIVDPFGGLSDLRGRRLRVLHSRSFADDATRLWRGARYAARLRLRPDPTTAALITEGGPWLATVSARRLWAEFGRTAAERRVGATLILLDHWGVLATLAPGCHLDPGAKQALSRRWGPIAPELLLAVVLAPLETGMRTAVEGRIGAPRHAIRAVADAAQLLRMTDDGPDILEALSATGPVGRTAALWLDPEQQRGFQRSLRRWERTSSPLDAHDLMRLGIDEGPALGQILHRLRRERYLGTLTRVSEARRKVRMWADEEDMDA